MSAMTTPTTAPAIGEARPTGEGIGAAVHDAVVMFQRNMAHYLRNPQVLVFVVIQPIMFVLLFRYVFGGAINVAGDGGVPVEVPGNAYANFLIPGIIVQTVAFNTVGGAIAIAEDLKAGVMDRFRSLPMHDIGVLGGRMLSSSLITLVTVLIIIFVGLLVGFRPQGSPLGWLAALALLMYFGIAFSWISNWIGFTLKEPEAVQGAGFTWIFPLTFGSSVFVPIASMPGWLQGFAKANPITLVSDATRGLFIGGPVTHGMVWSLVWLSGITVVFTTLAIRAYRSL